MQTREAYISNKHIGYFVYLKKYSFLNTKNKTLKINQSGRKKKNSLFRSINTEDLLYNLNKQEEDRIKIKDLRGSFSHNNSLNIPDHYNVQKKTFIDENIINNKYIPDCNFNFILDINSMSYKPLNNINSSSDLDETLKNQAINKISILQESIKDKNNISSNSNTSSSRDNNSSDNDSSIYIDSYDVNSSNLKSEIKKDDTNIIKNYLKNKNPSIKNNNNFYEQYYKVNVKIIKFIVYDFNKEKFVENKDEKKSQIENIIDNYKINKNMYTNEDENYPNYNNFNYSKEKVSKNIKNDKPEIIINQNMSKSLTKYEKEKDFEKEIIDSLKRKDEQKAITQLYGVVFLCTATFLLMNILEAFYIINSYSKLKENMKLVINSVKLKYYNNYDIYFLRETVFSYTTFDNITYISYNEHMKNETNNEIYKNNIFDLVKYSVYQSYSLIESILSTELSISKNTSFILYEMPFISETLINKTNFIKKNSTLSVSIVYTYSFLCNSIIDISALSITNSEIYNYIRNAMNNLGMSLDILIELFISELKGRISRIIKNIIFIVCVNIIVYIIIYFSNNIRYFKVINKKMSYLTIFYEIKLPLIKSSIKKCEVFLNKIKENIKFEKIDINEETINSTTLSNKSFNLNNEEKKNLNNFQKEEKNKEKKIRIDQKYRHFQLLFIMMLLSSLLFLNIIIIFYIVLIRNFTNITTYIKHMQNYHNNIIELHNVYREFLYDENSIIFGIHPYDYLIKKEEEIYNSNLEDLYNLNIKSNIFKDILQELNQKELCKLSISVSFENQEKCETYMGGKEGIINFGFDTLLNYFIEEIRMKRNSFNKLIKQNILVGNLSDFNEIQLWNNEYLGLNGNTTSIFRFNIFSNEEIHCTLNNIFFNIIYQYIDGEKNLTLNSIENQINRREIIYIILIGCHCALIFISILFFLVPRIKSMNSEIFQTKNMLTIVPVQILASLPNIKKLLNISNKIN